MAVAVVARLARILRKHVDIHLGLRVLRSEDDGVMTSSGRESLGLYDGLHETPSGAMSNETRDTPFTLAV